MAELGAMPITPKPVLLSTTPVSEEEERKREGRKERRNSATVVLMTQAYLPEELRDEQLDGKGGP